MEIDFEIIVGTYEQFLLGYKVSNLDKNYSLDRSFATHSHLASIRAVASNRHYLASGGADDSVFLYDMRYRMETGRLMHHSGTINCLNFTPEASHIITGSNDGNIGIVRCGNWELEKYWKSAHKGNAINALAIHPSGKLAMSTGGDGVLRTWNLVKGRQAYATNLVPRLKYDAKNVTILRWSPDGDKYLLASNCKVEVYSVETAGLCSELSFDSKVICVEFIKNDLLAIGHEDGKIRFYDIKSDSVTVDTIAHDARVKCLVHRNNYLVTASSAGEIKLWHYDKTKLKSLSETNCGARITCMTLADHCPNFNSNKETSVIEESKKRKTKMFRLRQEVIIENETDENTTKSAKKQKKATVKSARKRNTEDEQVSVKKKQKKIKTVSEESKTKKINKRNLLTEKTDESPSKKTKREEVISKKITLPAKKTKLNDSNNEPSVEIEKKKAKKIKTKKNKMEEIIPVEKAKKPVLNKRKLQNDVSKNSVTFAPKIKKKKLAR